MRQRGDEPADNEHLHGPVFERQVVANLKRHVGVVLPPCIQKARQVVPGARKVDAQTRLVVHGVRRHLRSRLSAATHSGSALRATIDSKASSAADFGDRSAATVWPVKRSMVIPTSSWPSSHRSTVPPVKRPLNS